MSYANQKVLVISNPIGLDKAIASLQQSLSTITYLSKIFGRAYLFKETVSGGDSTVTVPKAYAGSKEYENVMMNDNYTAMSFFLATGPAEPIEFKTLNSNKYKREIALIFWGNLKKINSTLDYVFIERIKADLLKALYANPFLMSVDSIEDDTYEKVFKEFNSLFKHYEGKTQYLQYPFAGIRVNITVNYQDDFMCNNPAANE